MRSRRPKQHTFHDYRMRSGRGGPRKGAGRKPAARPRVHHVGREHFSDLRAGHVTLRVIEAMPSLRCKAFVEEIRRSFAEACERDDFRLIHYSVLENHLHLLVEAEGSDALGRGMKSLSCRVARAANRVFERSGRVLDGRYYLHLLETIAEAWNALRYVLLNARKHFRQRFGRTPPAGIDWASSGHCFEGWAGDVSGIRDGPFPVERQAERQAEREGERAVARPKTWLLREGWKRRGPIDPAAVPGF